MKHIHIIIITAFLVLFSSCVEKLEPLAPSPEILDGEITIELKTEDNTPLSRSVEASDDEKKIHNAFIYIFNSTGAKVYAAYKDITGNGTASTTIDISKYNVNGNMTVAVLVNVGDENQVTDISTDKLFAVSSLTDLRKLKVEKNEDLPNASMLERGDMFVMYGEALLESTTTVTVKRVDAKVKFNIIVGTPAESITNLKFYPYKWKVYNVPLAAIPFNIDKSTTDVGDALYVDTPQWYNFEEVTNNGELNKSFIEQGDNNKATFEFYVPESIKRSTSVGTDYYKRDERKSDGSFTYAPKNSTYVEFTGLVDYNKTKIEDGIEITENVVANAVFTVHLGGLDKTETNYVENWQNFSSYGNTYYTYYITILGAESILANVSGGEGHSGITGEHTVTEFAKSVDAYNNVFNVSFNKDNVGDLKWHVSTPFSEGYSNDANPPKDYHWIHFKYKSTNDNNFEKYPGEGNVYTDDLSNDTEIAAFHTKYINAINSNPREDLMLTVDQLTKVLAYAKNNPPAAGQKDIFLADGIAYFTIFVDDFYYETDPTNGSTDEMLWQKFVNTHIRRLNITSLYDKSDDNQSISMESMYNITQNSIQTMYNTAPLEAGETKYTAFGSQFYPRSEPGKIDQDADFSHTKDQGTEALVGSKITDLPTTENDEFNGRKNYLELLKHIGGGSLPSWSAYINEETWTLNSDYDYPMFRPLLMNRDTNGDGLIQEDEIQWYLASLSQLIDLWVGEGAFNNASKLYMHNDWSSDHQNKQHYISSTIKKDVDGNPKHWVLWSSEGAATGSYYDSPQTNATELYYRTVRNLGIPRGTSSDTAPDRIGHMEKEGDHTYIVMNRLSPLALRPSLTTGKQASHNERDDANRPYKKFEIRTTGNPDGEYNFDDAANLDLDPDSDLDEWRLPNQRELILMMSMTSDSNDPFLMNGKDVMSATKFGWNPYTNFWDQDRAGFRKTTDNRLELLSYYFSLSGKGNPKGSIVSVKDVAN